MNFTAVESTTLATVAYDKARGLLQLEFRSRAIYQYFDVPAIVHEALLCAPSKGIYFNRVIRGRFLYRLVSNFNGDVPDATHLRPCQ
jgi:KTSC domain-containing protein